MSGYDGSFAKRCALLAPRMIEALKRRNIAGHYCATGAEAVETAVSLMPAGASVSWGGSVTIQEVGLLDAVRARGFGLIDRDAAPDTAARFDLMRQALSGDVFLTSVNAISEDGQMVNIDGVGNRVAAMAFGPRRVIVVVGMNKVCKTLEDAISRARNVASPLNAMRVGVTNTPCAKTGSCADCQSEECICSYLVVTRMNRIPDRMHVILVGEDLGY